MRKLYILCVIGLAVIVGSLAFAQGESITLTTYYPAPFGVYNEMRANKLIIGEPDSTVIPAPDTAGLIKFKGYTNLDEGAFTLNDRQDDTLYYNTDAHNFKYYDSSSSDWEEMGRAGAAIPSGFCIFSDTESACPGGWTRRTEFDGRTVRGAATPGLPGPADPVGRDTHRHSGTTGAASWYGGRQLDYTATYQREHRHSFTTDNISSWPPYMNVIICCKD